MSDDTIENEISSDLDEIFGKYDHAVFRALRLIPTYLLIIQIGDSPKPKPILSFFKLNEKRKEEPSGSPTTPPKHIKLGSQGIFVSFIASLTLILPL